MAKRKTGRPRTKLDSLPKGWKEKLVELGDEGASLTEMRKELGIGRTGWDTLMADSPEFHAAVKDAEEASSVWWERAGRKLAIGGGGNSAIWIFNMKNRFGWRDAKSDRETDPGESAPVSVTVNVVDGRKSDA